MHENEDTVKQRINRCDCCERAGRGRDSHQARRELEIMGTFLNPSHECVRVIGVRC
jgi:hypothetical protein